MKKEIVGAAMVIALGLVAVVGTYSDRSTRIPNRGAKLAVGEFHSCAVLADGRVQCWGVNVHGALGNGNKTDFSWVPVTVSGISNAVAVAAGTCNNSCVILANGRVRCWGGIGSGQVDNFFASFKASGPVTISGLTDAVAVAVGGTHDNACAVLADGRVQCWQTDSHHLKNVFTLTFSAPVTIGGLINAVAVAIGYNYTCAVLTDGRVRCWENTVEGQVGNGSISSSSALPAIVSRIANVRVNK